MSALVNLSNHYLEHHTKKVKENEMSKLSVYHDLIFKLMTLYFLSTSKTAKMNSILECNKLARKFSHAKRDFSIARTLNKDGGLIIASLLQGQPIKMKKNSKKLRAFVALLKKAFVKEKNDLLKSDGMLKLISHQINLLYQPTLNDDEQLEFYSHYYFNKVERKAHNDKSLEKHIFGALPHPDLSDKGQALFESLKFLSNALIEEKRGAQDTSQRLVVLEEIIQGVLAYYFKHFKEALLHSHKMSVQDEKKIEAFVMKYLNTTLKQAEMSHYYKSYMYGIVKFNALLRQPNQVVLTQDSDTEEIKVVFRGNIFERVNQLDSSKKPLASFFKATQPVAANLPRAGIEPA
jgi:hypothetical protein